MINDKSVLVEVGNVGARITPATVAEYLAPDLTYTATDVAPGGPRGYQLRGRTERLYRYAPDGALLVPAGLVPLAVDRLTAAGFQVHVDNCYSLDPRARPSEQVLGDVLVPDPKFLAAVAAAPRGLIEVRGAADVVRRVAMICRLFPMARTMIATNVSRKRMHKFRRRLEVAGAGAVHTLDYYPWSWEGGRLVCRLVDLGNSVQAPDRAFDVVVLPDAIGAVAPAHQVALARLRCHRVYGFFLANAAVSARTRLDLQALVGPCIYRAPDSRGVPATVTVRWLEPPWVPPAGDVGALQRKRLVYWHNDRRNDFLAAVARALRDRDDKALAERGLLLAEDDCPSDPGWDRRGVAVLVESTEHGRELVRRLPGWEMRDAVPVPPGCRPRLLDPLLWGLFDRTIFTCAVAARERMLDVDVLVLAGPEWPAALAKSLPRSLTGWRHVLLVDLADYADGAARAAVRRRLGDYAAQGWSSVGVPAWAVRDEGGTTRRHGRRRGGRRR
jgi:hypothetical protein